MDVSHRRLRTRLAFGTLGALAVSASGFVAHAPPAAAAAGGAFNMQRALELKLPKGTTELTQALTVDGTVGAFAGFVIRLDDPGALVVQLQRIGEPKVILQTRGLSKLKPTDLSRECKVNDDHDPECEIAYPWKLGNRYLLTVRNTGRELTAFVTDPATNRSQTIGRLATRNRLSSHVYQSVGVLEFSVDPCAQHFAVTFDPPTTKGAPVPFTSSPAEFGSSECALTFTEIKNGGGRFTVGPK